MFCGNCGANNPEGSSVCGSCGAPLAAEEESKSSENLIDKIVSKIPGGDKNKMIGLAVVAVVAVLVLALLIWAVVAMVGGGGAEKAATNYVKASLDAKGGKTLAGLIPDAFANALVDAADNLDDTDEILTELNDILEDYAEDYEDYFGKMKVSIEVRKVKNWKNSDIKDYQERLDDAKIEAEIQDGADVDLKITIDGDEKETYKPDPALRMVKIKGKWYYDSSAVVIRKVNEKKEAREDYENAMEYYEKYKDDSYYSSEEPTLREVKMSESDYMAFIWPTAHRDAVK